MAWAAAVSGGKATVMRDYGAQDKVGMVVAKSMCTEMGPFMAALRLCGERMAMDNVLSE